MSKLPSHLKFKGEAGPDILKRERSNATFDSNKLAHVLYGQEYLDRQDRILSVILKEPAFDKSNVYFMGREDLFKWALLKEKRFAQLVAELNWSKDDYLMAENLIDISGPLRLHKLVYVETLRGQCTDEQKKRFLEPAERYQQIGCYAQTELAHGSNVQGLETTATYDRDSKEFIINTPYLTSTKWWPGSLGRMADHAVVIAQLTTNGKSYGPHPFVVPIRDMKTREPLPGRTIGDIGPKVGTNGIDNGFLALNQVRIPHGNMLAKFSSVDRDTGKYNPPARPQLAYGSMTQVRARIVKSAASFLARAATISVRYCAIRKQFKMEGSKSASENQVLDYQSVQARIFPVIASVVAFHFTGEAVSRQSLENSERLNNGDVSLLSELHAATCALKSFSTIYTGDAIETCRRACGGHGYSLGSGLSHAYGDYAGAITAEGDSYMIPQQVARYLFKAYREYRKNPSKNTKDESAAAYLANYLKNQDHCLTVEEGQLPEHDKIIAAFAHRAAFLVATTVERLDSGATWNDVLVDVMRISAAHATYLVVHHFHSALEQLRATTSKNEMDAINLCFDLFALQNLDLYAADFLMSGSTTPRIHQNIRKNLSSALAAMRPIAVPLVDSFACPDYVLLSNLGRKDGLVYESIVDFAQRSR